MLISQVESDPVGIFRHAHRPIVLAVDDHEDSLLLLSCSLELFDCEVVGKTSGSAALAFVHLHQPALILLDLIMPDVQGIELLQLLRAQVPVSTPIVAISGMSVQENRGRLLAAGCSDYLGKPYLLEDLEAMVRRWGILPHDGSDGSV